MAKTFAVTAVIATAVIFAYDGRSSPLQAQDRAAHVTATVPVSGSIFGGGNQYAHLANRGAAAPARPAARGARYWRNARTADRGSRAASPRVTRAARRSYAAVPPTAAMNSGAASAWRLRFVRAGGKGPPLYRNQPDRHGRGLVRPLHEHGSGEVRTPRHRLQHGEFLRELWPPRRRAAGRRHRRDVARQAVAAMSGSCRVSTSPETPSSFQEITIVVSPRRLFRVAAFTPT